MRQQIDDLKLLHPAYAEDLYKFVCTCYASLMVMEDHLTPEERTVLSFVHPARLVDHQQCVLALQRLEGKTSIPPPAALSVLPLPDGLCRELHCPRTATLDPTQAWVNLLRTPRHASQAESSACAAAAVVFEHGARKHSDQHIPEADNGTCCRSPNMGWAARDVRHGSCQAPGRYPAPARPTVHVCSSPPPRYAADTRLAHCGILQPALHCMVPLRLPDSGGTTRRHHP